MPLPKRIRSQIRFLIRRLAKSQFSSSSQFTSVYSFGDNSSGALALSTPFLDAYEPTKITNIPSTSSISSIAAGHYHSLAINTNGDVFAWGRNVENQLGRGLDSPRDTWNQPAKVVGMQNAHAAFASGVVSAAIKYDGSLWVWGRSKRGQLGLGIDVTDATKPSKVYALSDHEIVKVSFGWGHALALTKAGELFGWGYCKDGRLGQMGSALYPSSSDKLPNNDDDGSSKLEIAERLVAQKLKEQENMPIIWEPRILEEFAHLKISDMVCGPDHSLIVPCNGTLLTRGENTGNGTLLTRGENTYGQLGRESKSFDPITCDLNSNPVSISAGLGHSLAICQNKESSSKRLYSWGWNGSHQLGRAGPHEVPGAVEGLDGENVISCSAARVHSIALTSKGEIWSWGSGRNGRLGLGSSMDEAEPALLESMDGMAVLQAVSGFDHNLLLVIE